MIQRTRLAFAIGAALLSVAAANGQIYPALQYGDFETISPADNTLPLGFGQFNGVRLRTVGDMLSPTLTSAHGGTKVIEMTPRPFGPSDFLGLTTDAPLDPDDANSPRNNPGYIFMPPAGEAVRASAWFMIPASDPIVAHRAGIKFEFRRTANNSVYEAFEIAPIEGVNPGGFPGVVGVTTPTGPGVHTNGQWLQITYQFEQSGFRDPLWPLPPINPNARVSVLLFRTGDPFVAGARGTIFWDDLAFSRVVACAADFNNSGAVTVQDIFDFLAAYFSSLPSADINNSGTVTVQDIFDYLALYFIGCS